MIFVLLCSFAFQDICNCNKDHCCYTTVLKQVVKENPALLRDISPLIVTHIHTNKSTATSQPTGVCTNCKGTKKQKCSACDGDFAKRLMREFPCDRKNGVGCDRIGTRTCFACAGKVLTTCAVCKGKGNIKTGYRKEATRDGRITKTTNVPVYRSCTPCRGSGKTKCTKCTGGTITCPKCRGVGNYRKKAICQDCKRGFVKCMTCDKGKQKN